MLSLEERKYPIGRVKLFRAYSEQELQENIQRIKIFPEKLEACYNELNQADFKKKYREGSWTIQEVIHHTAESHMVLFSRLKLCLTVDDLTVVPFPENDWVKLPDVQSLDPMHSVLILKGVHARISRILEGLSAEERTKSYLNPESNRRFSINDLIALYSWHGDHHLAQVKIALKFPA